MSEPHETPVPERSGRTGAPEIYAHRGFSRDGNENSLEAFRAAVELGVRWVETDVNTTADGVVLTVHDPDLARVTGRPDVGRVEDLDAAQVARLRLAGGASIPTLAEVLAALPGTCFNIDIKDEGSVAAFPEVVAAAGPGAVDRIRVASFSESRRRRVLAGLRARSLAGTPRGQGPRGRGRSETQAPVIRSSPGLAGNAAFLLVSSVLPVRACAAVWPLVHRVLSRWIAPFDAFQVPEHQAVGPFRVPVATPRFIRAAQACGYRVDVWTVDDPVDMLRLAAAGADGIVTDRTDIAVALFPGTD